MNWLAHIFLSEHNIDFQMGNFLADPLKGRVWEGASVDIKKGMQTHMIIDGFTDSHEIVSQSKARLRDKGRLKPIIIDLTYDYLLTKHWDTFSSLSQRQFLDYFNKNAIKRCKELPEHASHHVYRIASNDRLSNYQSLEDLKHAFMRMDLRLSEKLLAKESCLGYFERVCDVVDSLEEDFLAFFPKLCLEVKAHVDSDFLDHWKV